MSDAHRLDLLERRLGRLEDQQAIYQLLATYGPSADSGSDDVVLSLHIPEASYDSGIEVFEGAQGVADMIASLPLHRQVMAEGSAHIMSLPIVHVDGDKATAVCHCELRRYSRENDQFRVWRTSSVVFDLVRTDDGWKIAKRVNHLLDGTDASHDHFRAGLQAVGAIPAGTAGPGAGSR
jgi:hypothetical protein